MKVGQIKTAISNKNKKDKGLKCFVSPENKFNSESKQLANQIIKHQKNLSNKPVK